MPTDCPKRPTHMKCFLCDGNHFARDCPKKQAVAGIQQIGEETVEEAPEKVCHMGTLVVIWSPKMPQRPKT